MMTFSPLRRAMSRRISGSRAMWRGVTSTMVRPPAAWNGSNSSSTCSTSVW